MQVGRVTMKTIVLALCCGAAAAVLAQQAPPGSDAQGRGDQRSQRRRQASWPVVIPGPDSIYSKRCASCHGDAGAGAAAGSILPYVRYHTDKDLAQRIATAHSSALQLTAEEQRGREIGRAHV